MLDKRELALHALRRSTEALAETLNEFRATPDDFLDEEEIGEFAWDDDDGFETRNDWDMVGGVCFERGQWSAWHQEHE